MGAEAIVTLNRRTFLKLSVGGALALAVPGSRLASAQAHGQPQARVIRSGPRDVPQVCLTYDDLWDEAYTLLIAERFARDGLSVTFFPTGSAVQANIERPTAGHEDLYRRVLDMGHEFGCHTFSHPDITDLTAHRLVWWEIQPWLDAMAQALGEPYTPVAFRPPFGIVTDALFHAVNQAGGIPIVLWSTDLRDTLCSPANCAAAILPVFERQLRGGEIFLQHTVRASYEVLDAQLALLQDAELTPVPVSEMLAHIVAASAAG